MERVICRKSEPGMSERGFTIIELLVATALSGIVMACVYSTYILNQRTHFVQGQVSAMQQNLRAALYFMETEIRMAGYNPSNASGVGILTADTDSMQFTMDINDDAATGSPDGDVSDSNENITYSIGDGDGDGDDDLMRNDANGSGNNPVAENIDALDLVYLDEDGNPTTTVPSIRSVQISIVARTGLGDPGCTNTQSYSNQQGTVIFTAPGDKFRRRLLTAEVKCRNLGL